MIGNYTKTALILLDHTQIHTFTLTENAINVDKSLIYLSLYMGCHSDYIYSTTKHRCVIIESLITALNQYRIERETSDRPEESPILDGYYSNTIRLKSGLYKESLRSASPKL